MSRLKRIKEQRHFGHLGQAVCPGCGKPVSVASPTSYDVETHNEPVPDLCADCFKAKAKYYARLKKTPHNPKPKVCRICQKEGALLVTVGVGEVKLIGAWCYDCRDAYRQRQQEVLSNEDLRNHPQAKNL